MRSLTRRLPSCTTSVARHTTCSASAPTGSSTHREVTAACRQRGPRCPRWVQQPRQALLHHLQRAAACRCRSCAIRRRRASTHRPHPSRRPRRRHHPRPRPTRRRAAAAAACAVPSPSTLSTILRPALRRAPSPLQRAPPSLRFPPSRRPRSRTIPARPARHRCACPSLRPSRRWRRAPMASRNSTPCFVTRACHRPRQARRQTTRRIP